MVGNRVYSVFANARSDDSRVPPTTDSQLTGIITGSNLQTVRLPCADKATTYFSRTTTDLSLLPTFLVPPVEQPLEASILSISRVS